MATAKLELPVSYIVVTEDNLEEAESFCGGRIRGTKLPRKDQVVQFDPTHHPEAGEENARVGDVIVCFHSSTKRIFQVWSYEWFIRMFNG